MTLDVSSGELFIPVGNPSPDFAPQVRKGDNLFTDSVLVLDAVTGKLRWWYQLVANDPNDYDVAAAPALYHDNKSRRLGFLARCQFRRV